MKKFSVVSMVLALVLVANVAMAGLIVDVRAYKINGGATLSGAAAKEITVIPGDIVTFRVYAKVVDSNADETMAFLNTAFGKIDETAAGPFADISLPGTPPSVGTVYSASFGSTSIPKLAADPVTGDQELTDDLFFYAPRSGNLSTNVALNGTNWTLLSGTLSYTIKAGAKGDATLDWVPISCLYATGHYEDPGDPDSTIIKTNYENGYTSNGPLVIHGPAVPEPSTLVLLGLGALALVFVRRK